MRRPRAAKKISKGAHNPGAHNPGTHTQRSLVFMTPCPRLASNALIALFTRYLGTLVFRDSPPALRSG
jgi:hypothetical protein